jgi:phosphatidylglycerophosphate synthase
MPAMFEKAKAIYLATRKKHDQLFNVYFMRPCAAGVVSVLESTSVTPNQLTLLGLGIFVVAAMILVGLPSYWGGVLGILVLELSYLFDCADGMLARHKKLASKEGHLFDFFTDELKATLLVGALALRLHSGGGYGVDLTYREPGTSTLFLVAGIVAVGVIASAISLTNFVRRPEISGRETSVEAFYETVGPGAAQRTPVQWAAWAATTFLRFLGHYPSHLWLFALVGRLDMFFWIYTFINLAYLGRGWLGLLVRFGGT